MDVPTCRVGILQIWVDATDQDYNALDPRQQESVYIIDVAGQVESSAQDVAEMSGIIGSLQIEPVTP